jgi:hypothetical protein
MQSGHGRRELLWFLDPFRGISTVSVTYSDALLCLLKDFGGVLGVIKVVEL